MLNSHPIQHTDVPHFMTKTPGRAPANRGENLGALTVKGKNTSGVPRTPFHPASALHHKVVKDQKPGTTARLLADKTPLPNRIGTTLFQTPFPQKKDLKSSKLAFIDPDALNQTKSTKNGGGKTPDSAQRPSSTRKHVKHPHSATQNFETPMNRGNHWDVSDGDLVLPADMHPALRDTITENDDDFDEIEFMAPNTLDLPYQPPLDFELPDYKVLGKSLRNLAHSCPYDDSPSYPELDIVISDIAISTWDMLKLPPLSPEDDPFHKARFELAQASGKITVPISKTRPETATTGGTTMKAARTTVNRNTLPKNTLPGPVRPSHHKSTVSLSSKPVGAATRVATSAVRRPHTAIDMNKKRDKPVGVHGALMLVKNNLRNNEDVLGEDFLFTV